MGTEYIISKKKKPKKDGHLLFVVDDDQIMRRTLKRYLESKDFSVMTIKDGYDALVKLDEITPALIISDIRMEKLDGLSLLAALKNRLETKSIPVIFMTAYADDKIIKQSQSLGASFFLTKPFPLPSLEELVNKILKK
jgi:CheY-like chemotaxis protein